jgi:hypothetical protein
MTKVILFNSKVVATTDDAEHAEWLAKSDNIELLDVTPEQAETIRKEWTNDLRR